MAILAKAESEIPAPTNLIPSGKEFFQTSDGEFFITSDNEFFFVEI